MFKYNVQVYYLHSLGMVIFTSLILLGIVNLLLIADTTITLGDSALSLHGYGWYDTCTKKFSLQASQTGSSMVIYNTTITDLNLVISMVNFLLILRQSINFINRATMSIAERLMELRYLATVGSKLPLLQSLMAQMVLLVPKLPSLIQLI